MKEVSLKPSSLTREPSTFNSAALKVVGDRNTDQTLGIPKRKLMKNNNISNQSLLVDSSVDGSSK